MKKTYIIMAIVGVGIVYLLYRMKNISGVAAAQSAQAVATSSAPSTFVTARDNLENSAATGITNALSNWGF